MITVVFSCFNEENNPFFKKALEVLEGPVKEHGFEVICVDGGSTDETRKLVEAQGLRFLSGDLKVRAHRYNLGLQSASHEMVLFHHPRSYLMPEGLLHLAQHRHKYHWGAFTHRFDLAHPVLSFTSWYSNHVRGDLKGIYYLDHCLFARKDLLQAIGGFPPLEIFEDTEICLALSSLRRPVRLPFLSTTSAVRFLKNGLMKQAYLNQRMKLAYLFKQDKQKMYKDYEKGLELNAQFKE